jgi:hypothetical protein
MKMKAENQSESLINEPVPWPSASGPLVQLWLWPAAVAGLAASAVSYNLWLWGAAGWLGLKLWVAVAAQRKRRRSCESAVMSRLASQYLCLKALLALASLL